MSDLPVRLFIATKALVQYQGRVLILRESNKYVDGVEAGKFDVPGGRMTVPGESYLDALRREIREEAGLEIDNIKPFFVNEFRVTKQNELWQIVAIFFQADAVGGQVVLSDDHCEYLWIDAKNFGDYAVIENLHPVFQAYLAQ